MTGNFEKNARILDNTFMKLSPTQRLVQIAEHIPPEIIFTTSFSLEDQVIAHIIATERLPFKIITLDTGRLFPQTYEVWQKTEERYSLRIKACYPERKSLEDMVEDQGINGFYYSSQMRKKCCFIRKVEPLERALKNAFGWITGLRQSQSQNRTQITAVSPDTKYNLLKINPLYDLKTETMNAFIQQNDIPINSLYASGFLSIGCAPCTRAVSQGEDERAGRWWWETENTRECGLHVKFSSQKP